MWHFGYKKSEFYSTSRLSTRFWITQFGLHKPTRCCFTVFIISSCRSFQKIRTFHICARHLGWSFLRFCCSESREPPHHTWRYPPHVPLGPLGFTISSPSLVVRIVRPASLAIWHRGRSHRRPNRNESPNRGHFASLDLKKHADFSHRRPTSQDFRREFSAVFPVISDQTNVFSHR